MGLVYDLVGTGALLLSSPYWIWRSFRRPEEMRERWGGGPEWGLESPVWWHAASVGELEALRPVLAEVQRRGLHDTHAVTVLTPTGRARGQAIWGEEVAVRMAPLDWRPIVSKQFGRIRPASLILVETELWPALLAEAHRRGVPVGVVNGRISGRSFRNYNVLGKLFHPLLEKLCCVAARTESDAQFFHRLGVRREVLLTTGNTKYELPKPPANDPPWLNRSEWDSVLVLGSLRSAEMDHTEAALRVLGESLPDAKTTLVVLAPRHLERAPSFADVPRRLGLPFVKRTDIRSPVETRRSGPFVVLLDTLGELQDLWWIATAGFVGGTLAPLGGHNLFEPASRGCPTLFGPSVATVSDVADALLQCGGGQVVPDGQRLGQALAELASLRAEREERSQRALEAASRLCGGVPRTVDWLQSCGVLPSRGSSGK